MKKIILILFALLCLSSCRNKTDVNPGAKITDDLGKDFVFDKIPQKVISLAPSITETIFYLGAEEKLAGVTRYCDYPPEALRKKNVGGLLDPNLELIAEIKPDLIFLTTEGNSKMTYKSLTDLGYSVFVLNPRKIQDIALTMDKINSILKPEHGTERIVNFRKEMDSIIVKGDSSRTFAALLSVKPLITFNDNTFIGDIFTNTGYTNIFGSAKLDYPGIYDEDLLLKNPDYIFVLSDSSQTSVSDIKGEIVNRFSGMNAFKNNRYFILNENIFSRPGPRVMNALKSLKMIRFAK